MTSTGTTMYRNYITLWQKHAKTYGPRTALLYQVGGFFEIYDIEDLTTGASQANVRDVAEVCQLSLTVHALDDSCQRLFGGVPEGALSKYERILVAAGYTVVIVTQRKDIGGKVEERVVERISSPGCYVDGGGSTTDRRLVGCFLESLTDGPAALRRVFWAISAIDLATGQIWFSEGTDRDRFHQFMCVHPPSELVIWTDGGTAATAMADMLRSGAGTSAVHLRCATTESVAIDEAILNRFWAPVRSRLEWIARQPQARRCLAALMEFVADHQPSVLLNLQTPLAWVSSSDMRLGNAALEQLGVVSLRSSGSSGTGSASNSLLGLLDQCRSIAGRRLLRDRIMRPITDVTELNRRLDMIDRCTAAASVAAATATTERALRSLYDMNRLWRRLELGSASVSDMLLFVRSTEAAALLLAQWEPDEEVGEEAEEDPTVATMPAATAAPETKQTWCRYVAEMWAAESLSTMVRDGDMIPVKELPCKNPPPALVAEFAIGLGIRNQALSLAAEWTTHAGGDLTLADAEGGGFRVTGTKKRISAAHAFLRDAGDKTAELTTYKASSSLENKQLRELSAAHRAWWSGWVPLWTDFWRERQAALVSVGRDIHAALSLWCAELDVSWTMARVAKEWLWRRPVFSVGAGADADAWIAVEGLRHPILERLITVPYVPHTITLGSGSAASAAGGGGTTNTNGLLLYGMNAAGKSSLMKAIGLCVLLAQCGFPVPATSCRLAPFTSLFTRILGNDNLWAGLSSFAVEMTEFREILRFADEKALVLGDELCSGTESLSGTALVAAGVETLATRRTKFVFATHLHELATLPSIRSLPGVRAVHLRVRYDAATDRLIYDRELAEGAGSALYGLEVCKALDLPPDYLERATVLRKQLSGEVIPTASNYSASVAVTECGVCGTNKGRLETHHIRHQADAVAVAGAGILLHGPGNLVPLCETCHDDHHAGRLTIRGWEETSAGRRLRWERAVVAPLPLPASAASATETPDAHPPEVLALVRREKQFKSRVPVKRIQDVVLKMYGISLTSEEIRRL